MTNLKQTKTAKVQAMLRRPAGASLDAICKAAGWQPHSARAALSTLRRKGAVIDRRKPEKAGAPATYHLVAEAEAQA